MLIKGEFAASSCHNKDKRKQKFSGLHFDFGEIVLCSPGLVRGTSQERKGLEGLLCGSRAKGKSLFNPWYRRITEATPSTEHQGMWPKTKNV